MLVASRKQERPVNLIVKGGVGHRQVRAGFPIADALIVSVVVDGQGGQNALALRTVVAHLGQQSLRLDS